MKVLIVYAHPNTNSFNHAILGLFTEGLAEAGHTAEVVDLYEIGFDPCLSGNDLAMLLQGKTPHDIQAQQEKVSSAEGIVFIHPVWWTGPPAILKGWVDRVFSMGFAYAFDEKDGHPLGLLKNQKALIISTAGASQEEAEAMGSTYALKKSESEGIFKFCGIKDVQHVIFYNVVMADDETRKGYLEKTRQLGREF